MSGRRIEPGGTILRKKAAWRNGLMVGYFLTVSVRSVGHFLALTFQLNVIFIICNYY